MLAALFTEGMLSMILGLAGVFLFMEYPGTAGTGAAGGEGMVSQESKPERAYGLHQITKDERTLFFRNASQVCRVSIYYAGLQKLF